ncbi:hypothetical protein FLONG3_368 [Fusarium longipes]|uniref:Uncharacterized protein n=1 Tax=Fusarium longipes TaxID=694270 RepID=A0A395TAP6_9HYPO|nr:hypothetical protein FLONG3_368 [Fusarium longipes]
MVLPVPTTLQTVHPASTATSNALNELAKRLPPTKEPVHPPPTREARDIYKSIAKHGGKAIAKYAKKKNGKHSKNLGSLKPIAKGFIFKSWIMWLIAGIVIVVVLALIYLVWTKRDYKWRRAQLEEEAKAAFEGNNDDDIDPSTIPFGQPWSHRGMAERRAAAGL